MNKSGESYWKLRSLIKGREFSVPSRLQKADEVKAFILEKCGFKSANDIMIISSGKQLLGSDIVAPTYTCREEEGEEEIQEGASPAKKYLRKKLFPQAYVLINPSAGNSSFSISVANKIDKRNESFVVDVPLNAKSFQVLNRIEKQTKIKSSQLRLLMNGMNISNNDQCLFGDYILASAASNRDRPVIFVSKKAVDLKQEIRCKVHFAMEHEPFVFDLAIGETLNRAREILFSRFYFPRDMPFAFFGRRGKSEALIQLDDSSSLLDAGIVPSQKGDVLDIFLLKNSERFTNLVLDFKTTLLDFGLVESQNGALVKKSKIDGDAEVKAKKNLNAAPAKITPIKTETSSEVKSNQSQSQLQQSQDVTKTQKSTVSTSKPRPQKGLFQGLKRGFLCAPSPPSRSTSSKKTAESTVEIPHISPASLSPVRYPVPVHTQTTNIIESLPIKPPAASTKLPNPLFRSMDKENLTLSRTNSIEIETGGSSTPSHNVESDAL